VIDDFCSEARVSEHGGEDGKEEKCLVYGRKKEKDIERSGFVHIFVRSSHDLIKLLQNDVETPRFSRDVT
jgi:hypothetical protein